MPASNRNRRSPHPWAIVWYSPGHSGRARSHAGVSRKEDALEAENAGLRELLTQAEIDAARLLAKAGIDATENEAAKRLQRLLLEELHHRVKNTLATVLAITSQSLRTAETLEQGRLAVESRLMALGRAHDLLLASKLVEREIDRRHSGRDRAVRRP